MNDHDFNQSPTSPAASPTDASTLPDADIRARLAAHPWPVFGAALTERLRADAAARVTAESSPVSTPSPSSPNDTRKLGRAGPTQWSRREVWGTAALALLLVTLAGLAWQAGSMWNAQPGPGPNEPAATPTSEGIGLLPEGAAVAWIDDDGLWYLERGGPPRPLSGFPQGMPLSSAGYRALRISPDRKMVAFQDVEGSIHLLATDGGTYRKLLNASRLPVTGTVMSDLSVSSNHPYRRPTRLTWTPDSRWLVFSTEVVPTEDPLGNEVDDMWIVGFEGKPRRLLLPGRAAYFAISPDGKHVAATGYGDSTRNEGPTIELVDLDGTGSKTLLELGPTVDNGHRIVKKEVIPQWSPDSKSLLVAVPKADRAGVHHVFGPAAELLRLPVGGDPVVMGTVVVNGGALNGVRWTPDGLHTAFIAPAEVDVPVIRDTGPSAGPTGYPPPPMADSDYLVVADQDGSHGQVVATGQNLALDGWSPDGGLLMFRDRSLDQPTVRIVRIADQYDFNQGRLSDGLVQRFLGPRDLLFITAAPSLVIGVQRVGVGGRDWAQAKSTSMVEFDIVPASGVADGVPPAATLPVFSTPDASMRPSPFPTPTDPRQRTSVPSDAPVTAQNRTTLIPTISPANDIESFRFVPGTADVAFTVSGNFPGNPHALFVRYMDPTAPQSVTRSDPLAPVPIRFSYVAAVRAGAVGGPLFILADRGNWDFDILPVDRTDTNGVPAPMTHPGRRTCQRLMSLSASITDK